MRYIILLLTILFVACAPEFKEGDCIGYDWDENDFEQWEFKDLDHSPQHKIFKVGKRKYMLQSLRYITHYRTDRISTVDLVYKKVDCPSNK